MHQKGSRIYRVFSTLFYVCGDNSHCNDAHRSKQKWHENTAVRFLLLLFIASSLAACQSTGNTPNKPESDGETGVLMVFSEREAGSPLFRSRVFVSDKYVYMDDARVPADFLLFNRQEQKVYTVNSSDKSVFVIEPKKIAIQSPIEIDYTETSQPSSAIPTVGGGQATHYRYDANGKHCYDAVTLEKSFLPGVIDAFKEFRLVLAGEHASSLHRMPAENHDACELALNIFYATKHWGNGVPLREWDQKGYLKFMIDYREGFTMKSENLTIPADYRQYSVSG